MHQQQTTPTPAGPSPVPGTVGGGGAAPDGGPADLVLRLGRWRTLAGNDAAALAVTGERISALSEHPHGLDHLIGEHTRVIDAPTATGLPAFDDTHTHLVYAGQGIFNVPVHLATDIPGLLALLRERAAAAPPGTWILSTSNWQEANLAEGRFPTRQELDTVSDSHPVLLRRGGHNAVANSLALGLAGITRDTADPAGGAIDRDADGEPTGALLDTAMLPVDALLPAPDEEQTLAGLEEASRQYAASGIGTVRDALVSAADLRFYALARDQGRLHVRVRALADAFRVHTVAEVDRVLDDLQDWAGRDDDRLRVWGVKLGMDGGLEAGATSEGYASDPGFHGVLMWEPEPFLEAVLRILDRGWRVGTHAFGDRAVQAVVEGYERALELRPGTDPRRLVLEHAGLTTPEQRRRIAALGLPVTIQQPLQHDTAKVGARFWGLDRVARLFPARSWLEAGALVSGGSDFPVGQFGAMRSVWGMSTRQTAAGVLGAGEAISSAEGVRLHTINAALTLGEEAERGTLEVGKLADLTVWDVDPFTAAPDALREAMPLFTIVGGRIVAQRD